MVCSLPLASAEFSMGRAEPGARVAGWDPSHSLHVEFLISQDKDAPGKLTFTSSAISNKPARDVLAATEFCAAIHDGCSI